MKYLERSLCGTDSTGLPQIKGVRFPRSLAVTLLVMATTLASNRATAQSTPQKPDAIRGIVINRMTREPIPRALVSSSNQQFAMLTDSEGRFEFAVPQTTTAAENLLDNNFNRSTFMFARKPGFLTENTVRDYSSGKELTIALVPEALIVGKVTLPNAEAPDSISVEIYRRQILDGLPHWVFAGSTQSRSDGEFRFAELRAGAYKVLTRELLDRDPLTFDPQGPVFGYPPVYGQNAPDFGSANTIQVSAGMTAAVNLSVTRKAYHRIQIPVANAMEAGALNVTVYPADHRGPGFSLGYSNQNHAIEGLLPDGSYTIEASGFAGSPGAGTGFLTIGVHGGPVRGPAMTLVPNASIRVDVNEEFTSTDNSGSITFNTGRRSIKLKGPRSYLNVVLEPADDYGRGGMPTLREPTGSGDEALVIENARPGRYWVRATSNRGYAASVRSGNIDLRREPLVIAAGGSPSPIEITMRDDSATIDGTVEGITPSAFQPLDVAQGNGVSVSVTPTPVAPAHVYCVPLADSSGQYSEVWVSPDGTFASPPMAPGAYRVLAFDRPQSELEYRNPEAMQAYETKGPVVRVSGGQKEHVRVQLISSNE